MAGALDFEDVHLRAPDGTEVLRGVDLHIAPGGCTVLAGPSGSGKSTLLRLGNRLEAPSSGSVRLDGVDLASMDPLALRRRVCMVFQRATALPGTVADNLAEAEPGDDASLVASLEGVGLAAVPLDRSADDLSGGELARLGLARTLRTRPEVVLFDEATSSLDVDATQVIERLARGLVAEGRTVVWVTHDLDQAERMGGVIEVVAAGRVVDAAVRTRCLAERSFAPVEATAS